MIAEPEAKRAKALDGAGKERVVPVTLLSGFLGAGKTTLLKHLLENKLGLKIGVIVNDVAEVNIDKSLLSIKAAGNGGSVAQQDVIELQNGCACCSLGEEFLESIGKMMTRAAERGQEWDHIVVESSGVAEPREIRDNFRDALVTMQDALQGTRLDTLVTVVDASTFLTEYEKRNRVNQRTDLGADDYSETNTRQVVDLMCEQVECADVILINKVDLATPAEIELLKETILTLNPLATLHTSTRGVLPLPSILGAAQGGGVAKLDEDGEMRRMVRHLSQPQHEHGHAGHVPAGHVPAGQVPGHVPDGHVPGHDHGHAPPGPGAFEEASHSHHDHGHAPDAHVSGHDHSHAPRPEGRESKRFGITSFCYARRRPFHPHRLMGVIRQLPVRQETLALSQALRAALTPSDAGAPPAAPAAGGVNVNGGQNGGVNGGVGGGVNGAGAPVGPAPPSACSPLSSLIRAKGFLWLSNSDSQIFYWQLAGKHFELTAYDTWWSSVGEEGWPAAPQEKEDILKDVQGEFGDRRQEMVFIGVGMDRPAIEAMFDACLLSDQELDVYRSHWAGGAAPTPQ